MTSVLSKLKTLNVQLGYFAEKSVIIELEADSPDDACYLAYKELCDYVTEQEDSLATKRLLRDLKDDFRVIQLIQIDR